MSVTTPQTAPMASPYEMKEEDKTSNGLTPTVKSYNNRVFLNSPEARTLRILTEFQEPATRLTEHDVRGTILFFGSARSMGREQYKKTLDGLSADLAKATTDEEKKALNDKVERFKKVEWMCKYVDLTHDIAKKMTEWSVSNKEVQEALGNTTDFLTGREHATGPSKQPLLVTTGGGPGIMEAANKGAAEVEGAKTVGMGISLPFEKGLNPYVTKNLAFEFHYFFTRKYWMMYSAKALILGPGGFGTFDELFELLTLRQTGKIADLPIVLLGAQYWKTVINWQAMADFGVISQAEVDKLFFADDVDSAVEYLTAGILASAKKAQKK